MEDFFADGDDVWWPLPKFVFSSVFVNNRVSLSFLTVTVIVKLSPPSSRWHAREFQLAVSTVSTCRKRGLPTSHLCQCLIWKFESHLRGGSDASASFFLVTPNLQFFPIGPFATRSVDLFFFKIRRNEFPQHPR